MSNAVGSGREGQIDPLADMEISAIYNLDINDGNIDLAARLFRECEAMVAYIGARGIEASQLSLENSALLDIGIKHRSKIPISSLLKLHGELSAQIKPALPKAVELMQWDARAHPVRNWIAPVGAIRNLMLFAIFSILIFCGILIFGNIDETDIADSIFSTSRVTQVIVASESDTSIDPQTGQDTGVPSGTAGSNTSVNSQTSSGTDSSAPEASTQTAEARVDYGKRATLLIYFFSLAGIGAAFATLYDAHKYVTSGEYDPRAGSNYTIRIILGLMAGLLLSQVLSNPLTAPGDLSAEALKEIARNNPLTSVSKTILALVGGFAAQFVYTALKRIVDALEGIFTPDKELRSMLELQKADLAKQASSNEEVQTKSDEITRIAGQIANASTDKEKQRLTELLVSLLSGGTKKIPTPTVKPPQLATAESDLKSIEKELVTKSELIMLLPPEQAEKAKEELDGLRATLTGLASKGTDLLTVDNLTKVARLSALAAGFNPMGLLVGTSLGVLSKILGNKDKGKLSSLVMLIVNAGKSLDDGAYKKWKNILLGQQNAAKDMPLDDKILTGAKTVLGAIPIVGPILKALTKKDGKDEASVLKSLAEDILKSDKTSVVDKVKKESGASDDVADDLVELLSSYLVSESELGDTIKTELQKEDGAKDLPIDELIALARRAVGSGQDGQIVIERLISLADLVADKANPVSVSDVRSNLPPV